MSDEAALTVLLEIRNWVRAASFGSVKSLLEAALPDSKSREAYQMLDGIATVKQICAACKMSPNGVVTLSQRCTAMGLMESRPDKKRVRLFDLNDFGLMSGDGQPEEQKIK